MGRISNEISARQKLRKAIAAIRDEQTAFDSLPPRIRKHLSLCTNKIPALTVLPMLLNFTEEEIIADMHRYDSDLTDKISQLVNGATKH